MFKEKERLIQDFILPPNIYIHICTLYTYTDMCILIFRPSKFFGLSRRLVPTPGLTSKDPMQRVCVCAYIYTHTYAPTPRQSREDIRQQPYLSLSKNQPPISETSALPRLAEPPHPHQVHVTQTMSEVNSISCTRNLDINL